MRTAGQRNRVEQKKINCIKTQHLPALWRVREKINSNTSNQRCCERIIELGNKLFSEHSEVVNIFDEDDDSDHDDAARAAEFNVEIGVQGKQCDDDMTVTSAEAGDSVDRYEDDSQ